MKTRKAKPVAMTPGHPRWREFRRALAKAISAEECDATSLALTERILAGMVGIDVQRSVEFFRRHGGFCDCEVLANVAESVRREKGADAR